MTFYNVHTTTTEKLCKVLNAHAARGWELHHVRGHQRASTIVIVFKREMASVEEWRAYEQARRERHKLHPWPVKEEGASDAESE